MQRENFKSRTGFLLVSAGCAIGIGNVWRFPYVTGQNGGGSRDKDEHRKTQNPLSCISCAYGNSRSDNGACSRQSKQKKCRIKL